MFQAQLPSISSLCKNETNPLPLIRVFPLVLELEPSFHLPNSRSSYPPGEHFHISNQVFQVGYGRIIVRRNESQGHVKPLATMLGVSFARNHAGANISTSVYHVNGIFQAQFSHQSRPCIKMKPILEHSFKLIFELVKNNKMVLSLLFIFRALVKTLKVV